MLEDKPDEAYMCDVHVGYVGASRHEFTLIINSINCYLKYKLV